MDLILELEKEKDNCIKVIKNYNLKYKTPELKKLYIIYDYLNEKLNNETDEVIKCQLKSDIEILIEYLRI